MSASVIGPLRGIVHSFEAQTFDERSSYKLVANVTEESDIERIKAALEAACDSKRLVYPRLERPPVKTADQSNVETVNEGLVVECLYRLDANHMSPFANEEGNDFIQPFLNNEYIAEMKVGRKIKFGIKFNARPPSAEAVNINGRVVRRAQPNGALYCDLVVVQMLAEVVEVGNVLQNMNLQLEEGETALVVKPTIVPNEQAAQPSFGGDPGDDGDHDSDIPF